MIPRSILIIDENGVSQEMPYADFMYLMMRDRSKRMDYKQSDLDGFEQRLGAERLE